MTVKELIELLQEYPSNMLVYSADSEYGNEEIYSVEEKKVNKWEGKEVTEITVVLIY